MAQPSIALRAGWTRILMGVFGITILPLSFPTTRDYLALFVAYLVVALLIQLAIYKGIGGNVRVMFGGVVDLALLTFFVHQIGSTTTAMVSIYLLIGVMNALAVGLRQGQILAGLGALAYISVILAEQQGFLPYAPDPPPWGANRPTFAGALTIGVLTGVLMFLSTSIVGSLVDVIRSREKQLLHANAMLQELSQKDPLTQLCNRRHLVSRIEHELARVRRGHPMVALMIDLDRFKQVNDTRGHLVGDEVLTSVAGALESSTRATDVAGRYGGDEFLVLLTDTDEEHAAMVAERLVKNVAEATRRVDASSNVTASVGLASARRDDRVTTLLKRADDLCYAAKQKGGNRFVAGE